jgi:hypothetical protein
LLTRLWTGGSTGRCGSPGAAAALPPQRPSTAPADTGATQIYAHNLELRKGPDFRVYVAWLAGVLDPIRPRANPDFDQPDSFLLNVAKGVIRVNIGDLAGYLNAVGGKRAPMQHIRILPDGQRLRFRGTVHRGLPLPVEVIGSLSPTAGGGVRLHVEKISVLKLPVKGLLGSFSIRLSDLIGSTEMPGVDVAGDDVVFNTERLLPPPHIRGQVTAIRIRPPDVEVIYGNAPNDPARLAQWHNFLRFRGGTMDFGNLTLHGAELTMIDAMQEPWFYLDLVHYRRQVMNGYTRLTEDGGLEVYMPSLQAGGLRPPAPGVTLDQLRDRNASLPAVPAEHQAKAP